METFRKWQDEVSSGFNKNSWLAVDVSKVGRSYAKRYVDSRTFLRLTDKQGEYIGGFHQTIHNITKGINIMSTTIDGMGQELHNIGKEMEYYAAKLRQV